ncbi:MAG TPA: dephospho-CoA kinase [Burkholderiales bacterium]|nr:dephospho-CoA kinase [Burkholderiales bacterium]
MTYCIGLTGGIGSGKSSASSLFQELGAGVVDTDEIAHALTGPGGAAIPEIRRQFGADYIAADGSLDRPRMRRLIFGDPASKKTLETILHPLIRRQSQAQIAAMQQPYTLVVVPLLLETGAYRELISRVLVVDCSEEQQIARTVQRSRLTADEVRAIMAAQLPRNERLSRADDVLHNDNDIASLRRQAEILHAKYLSLSR